MSLTDQEKNRYSRHILLDKVGLEGQEKLKSAKVLVVGDVMLDRYWHGATSRISPEAGPGRSR